MELDLAAIRKRYEAATDGPWRVSDRNEAGDRYVGPADEYLAIVVRDALGRLVTDVNAEFIAHARTDLPAVVEALEEARVFRTELEELIDGDDSTLADQIRDLILNLDEGILGESE